jgi:hypothetical protein
MQVPRILVTPTRVALLQPEVDLANRVLRNFCAAADGGGAGQLSTYDLAQVRRQGKVHWARPRVAGTAAINTPALGAAAAGVEASVHGIQGSLLRWWLPSCETLR